ncbi:uncharacterized protein LOC127363862 [Dicentrarchus labrax]|uniref:uncharacterized protein LOC127363862 n=1 Tax=Dicentrarchus labrax TaxID=13489 RepID=UPI0021F62C49|nr:uncharacterized protein LOC127363862 [Dicentrarchus labrax]
MQQLDINMDSIDEYIWERRIHHGVRRQKSSVPFPESVKIGLEFNAAVARKEKLDWCFLTNAVMLELWDFAKTVTKSEMYFLFEMLEFNFELGLDMDSDRQCYEYTARVHNKIKLLKEQIKMKPHRWKETFPLPDLNVIMTGSGKAERYYPKRNKTVDISVLTDGSKNSKSSEDKKTESNGAASSELDVKKQRGVRPTTDAYPFCKELGVSLTVRPDDAPRQKLDPNLVTNGVMMELFHFSKGLCGTQTGIIHDLVTANFGQELDKTIFRTQLTRLMERKYSCPTAEDREAFRKEAFKVETKKRQYNAKKRKRLEVDLQELESLTVSGKRSRSQRIRYDEAEETWQDGDLSYMCPVDFETEMKTGTEAGPEQMKLESCLTKSSVSVDVKQEEEEVFVSPVQPQTNVHLRPKTVNVVSNLFSEDKNEDTNVKTLKQKLWTRRAARSKQILKSIRVRDMFARCREIGVDFNVGSGHKQNLDVRLITNSVLLEVYKFAMAMSRSLHSFLYDVLNSNFNLVLQDDLHRRNFIYYIITKEKVLQNHPRRNKEFLSSPFQFPEVYNMVDVTSDFQTGQEVETEQLCDSQATSKQVDTEPHPFCKKLGVNLWSTEQRPTSQKLDLTELTSGAMLEIFCFVRELCGAACETVNDILEHNFNLDLQSGETEAARVIQRWLVTQKNWRKQTTLSKVNRWLNKVVSLNGHQQLSPQPPTGNGPLKHLDPEDLKLEREMGDFSKYSQEVNSYHICKEIGLDLDVGSKSESKKKLDLRVLTRGVLFELHRYIGQNCKRYVPALYEILDYNFDLSSQSHRKVEFAWSIASQVIAMVGKNVRKGDYLNKVFELPFELCESSQIICKEEPQEGFGELDINDNSDITFVRELKPVDIEVEVE